MDELDKVIAGDKQALEAQSRWIVWAWYKSGKLKKSPLIKEIQEIVESCKESR